MRYHDAHFSRTVKCWMAKGPNGERAECPFL